MNPILKLINDLIEKGFEYFGRYYSSYRGFVVDNADPENYGRLRIQIPQVTGTGVMSYWAWPKGQFSGKGYGFQCTPQKGDMVYVEFEQGDPRKPIWTYGHFARDSSNLKEKPEELNDIGNFWFKTPGGHLIEFDDTNKFIRVTNTKGHSITLNEIGVSIISDKISFGKLDGSAEPSVLGNTLKTNLENLVDLITNLSDSVQLLTVPTPMGPSGVPFNAADFQVISQSLSNLKTNLSDILSQVATTD